MKEFDGARQTLLHQTMKALAVIHDADAVRRHKRNFEELYEYNDGYSSDEEDGIGVQDYQLSHMITNAKRLRDIAEEIVRIAGEHESEASTHFMWYQGRRKATEDGDMSDEFLEACYQRKQNLQKDYLSKDGDGEDFNQEPCAIQ